MPSLVTNVWQLFAGPAFGAIFRRLFTMMVGVCLGTFVGIGLLTSGSSKWASIALGSVLAVYAIVGLFLRRLSVSRIAEPLFSPAIGFITGVLTGATGVFVVPAVPYLSALNLEREELIQALGLSFTISTIALAAALAFTGSYPTALVTSSALAVIPALVGMFIGQQIREKLHPDVFRRWFFWAMMAVGVFMVVRAMGQK